MFPKHLERLTIKPLFNLVELYFFDDDWFICKLYIQALNIGPSKWSLCFFFPVCFFKLLSRKFNIISAFDVIKTKKKNCTTCLWFSKQCPVCNKHAIISNTNTQTQTNQKNIFQALKNTSCTVTYEWYYYLVPINKDYFSSRPFGLMNKFSAQIKGKF